MSSVPPGPTPSPSRTASDRSAFARRLPLAGVLRPNKPSDIWFKPATSVVVAAAVPNVTLLVLGRLDLVMYTMAGSFCALYAHNLPYAARARALAWVVAGMFASVGIALVTASLTTSVAVLVAVGAVLAATQKAVCDATRIGPPGHLIFTFISSASLFAPQRLGDVPGHLALTAGAGAVAWIVGMAPVLVRPHGPERRAVARALNAAAACAERPDHAAARGGAAAAVHAAWQSLLATGELTKDLTKDLARERTGERTGGRGDAARRALARLVVRAEVAIAAPGDADAAQLRGWAAGLRGAGAVPRPRPVAEGEDELLGIDAEFAAAAEAKPSLWRRIGPGSPVLPVALRTFVGCALAGYASLALGIGRPYWALVTAASLYQANVTLTWSRGVQRVVGNLAGVLVFAAIAPVAHGSQAALVLFCLAFSFGAEALITRNYWLGSLCVTPMALLVTEFARFQEAGELITDRVVDTLVGAALGVLAAVVVTNRRAGDHLERALAESEAAQEAAERVLAHGAGTLEGARRRLAASLVELRAAVDTAAGEWWQRALPEERVLAAERAGHRTLAATVRRQESGSVGETEGAGTDGPGDTCGARLG
ncbi:FUSC family protein [Streptomyces sp. SID8379]|uniref:FUSC family protein n=1 Tax=unclassified Streptomyces TaxID=2593676 RepID=UPI000998922E|nr:MULTISPECIES: FUSC family protein [unclassified Streptomyces]MYW63064.1 FUSC family protein [Streptomyces sp. SID8379]